MKIYTGQGDKGQTMLFSGERVGKDCTRVTAFGTLDELNSVLGVALAFCQNEKVRQVLSPLQHRLFTAGADLATIGKRKVERIQEKDWRDLERLIDEFQESLPALKTFILPGGTPAASLIHLSRAVCRRAERLLASLMSVDESVNTELLVYLNRLSDLLFLLARYENIEEGGKEETWRKQD